MSTVWGHREGNAVIVYSRFMRDLEKIPAGVRVRMKIDLDRNGKFNALFHVMLSLLTDAINRGPAQTDIDKLKQWVKLKTGRYDVVKLAHPVDGQTHAIDYHSTSFAKMGEAEFQQFARDSCDLICAELAPWISNSPEWGELRAIIAGISPTALEHTGADK